MRTNNAKVKGTIISLYFLLVLTVFVLVTVFSVFKELELNPVIAFVMLIFLFMGIFVALFNIARYFEYDSDGLKVGVLNKGLLATDFLKSKEHNVEFDKSSLVNYKFQNFLVYKRLVLYILNKRGHIKKEIFNVTLVSRKKRKYVRQSLRKIKRQNKEKKKLEDDRRP